MNNSSKKEKINKNYLGNIRKHRYRHNYKKKFKELKTFLFRSEFSNLSDKKTLFYTILYFEYLYVKRISLYLEYLELIEQINQSMYTSE